MTRSLVYLTTSQVADRAQVDSSTVRRWVTAGHLVPAVTTPGGQYRFRPADVDALLSPAVSLETQAERVS